MDYCNQIIILYIVYLLKIFINTLKIIIPILLIVIIMIDFFKVISSDSLKINDIVLKSVKRFIAAIVIFFIPTIVVSTYKLFTKNDNLLCVNDATRENINNLRNEKNKSLNDIRNEELNNIQNNNNSSNSVSKAYYWPVGSNDATNINGVLYATGEPATTWITANFSGDDAVHQGSHGAIDIGALYKYVIATQDGVVIYPKKGSKIDYPETNKEDIFNGKLNCNGVVGNYVEIDHGNGIVSIYHHLLANSITVTSGDYVKRGQVIGKSGSSGCAYGVHLHFEIQVNGKAVDPLNYVDPNNPRPD